MKFEESASIVAGCAFKQITPVARKGTFAFVQVNCICCSFEILFVANDVTSGEPFRTNRTKEAFFILFAISYIKRRKRAFFKAGGRLNDLFHVCGFDFLRTQSLLFGGKDTASVKPGRCGHWPLPSFSSGPSPRIF